MLIHQGRITCAFSPEIKCPGKQKVSAQSMAEKAKMRGRTHKHSSVQISCPRDSDQRACHTSAHHQTGKHTERSTPLLQCSPSQDTSLLPFGDCCPLGPGCASDISLSQYWKLAQHWPLSAGCSLSASARTGSVLHVGVVTWGIPFSHRPQGVNRRKISYC